MDESLLPRTFNEVAEGYDQSRPSYPEELFDDLAALAPLPPAARIVEIGCGTGQATLPLATRGYRVTCVELGDALAAVARRRLATFDGVEVVTSPFETWQPSEADFDAVVAFTSFHWIDPGARYAKAAALLRERGLLSIVTTHHVLAADGDAFFREVQEDYETILPDDPATRAGAPSEPDLIEDLGKEIAASGLFVNRATRRYVWNVDYHADDYVRLLQTYSGHRSLDAEKRDLLLGRIHDRIARRPGKTVSKTYLAILNVAEARRKKTGTPRQITGPR